MSGFVERDEFERRTTEILSRFENVTPGIPAGMILLWKLAAGATPVGWAVCDGTNGTPNLAPPSAAVSYIMKL